MTTRRSVLGGLFLSLTVGIPAQVIAQDDLAIARDPTLWPGLVTAVGRSYSVDGNATPVVPVDGTRSVTMRVFEFATASDAANAYSLLTAQGAAIVQAEDANAMVGSGYLNAPDEPTWKVSASTSMGEYIDWRFGQRETYLLASLIRAGSNVGLSSADELFDAFHAGAASPDESAFVAAGGSTGGLWGFFPTDNIAYEGLAPVGDEIVFPVTS